MKIMLFRDGRRGVVTTLPGDQPEAELAELLGGETEMSSINAHLKVVTLEKAQALQLPIRYAVNRLGRAPEPVAGDCCVIAVTPEGVIRDIRRTELPDIQIAVCPVEV